MGYRAHSGSNIVNEQNPPKRKIVLLKIAEVKALTKLSHPSIYRLIATKRFPRPIKLGDAASAWIASEINEWLESRIEKRNQEAQEELAREEMVKEALAEANPPLSSNPLLMKRANA
jgi:prophage regulatory protein